MLKQSRLLGRSQGVLREMSNTGAYRGKGKVSEGKFKCSECGADFETSQALGSHVKYRHGSKKDAPPREGLDLKNAFVDLLHDVGVRRGARTIAEIYFGTGGDSMENLDRTLRLSGVSNPARSLILRRWGQRVNKQVGENLLKGEKMDQGASAGGVFEAYERMRESELQELLMDDLRTRIDERRKKMARAPSDEDIILRKIDKLSEEVSELRLSQTISRPLELRQMSSQLPTQPTSSYTRRCDNPYHFEQCVICGRCGVHVSIAWIPIGQVFSCPTCGAIYLRDHW